MRQLLVVVALVVVGAAFVDGLGATIDRLRGDVVSIETIVP